MPDWLIALKSAETLLKLGFAVVEAIASGNRGRTVGEIFDGVTKDMDEIDRLELERFGAELEPGEHPEDDPEVDHP